MTLKEIQDYIESLGVSEKVHIGKLPGNLQEAIGVYNSKHTHEYKVPLGGTQMRSYETKYITLLIHWNKSPTETEEAGKRLFDALTATREKGKIKFIQPLYDLQDIGTDDSGVYEMVIEVAFICRKENENAGIK